MPTKPILRHKNARLPPLRPLLESERQFVADNLGLAKKLASQMALRMASRLRWVAGRKHSQHVHQYYEDLFQAGVYGLCVGIQRYKPDGGSKPSSYSHWWVRNYIYKAMAGCELRSGPAYLHKFAKRLKLFGELEADHRVRHDDAVGFDIWDSRGSEGTPLVGDITKELSTLLRLRLSGRPLRIVELHLRDISMRGIAKIEGITHQRVQQLFAACIRELKSSKGFMQALEKQMWRRRQELNHNDFSGMGRLIA